MDLSSKADGELDALIANHMRAGAFMAPLYRAAIEERARRRGNGLEVARSFEIIRAAALERRFISMKMLADASRVDWGRAHYAIGEHLYAVNHSAVSRGLPMIGSIVVNQENLASGKMNPDTLKGFVAAAMELKRFGGGDAETLLRQEQDETFAQAVRIAAP